uniref:HNH endonuclease n=1 Tax=Marseillevirus LCMAC101 TaxID=2506602 RepID=A0A481YS86_9VIRU|nr:MAG: HNH endonuclease [Marseillevirus LCMAC101]
MEISGLENYLIHSDGRVYSKYVKRFLSLRKCNGYYNYRLNQENVGGKRTINITGHILVARAYLPNPNNLPEVNHKDGNGFNNRVDNLEWISRSDNINHSIKTGIRKQSPKIVLQCNKKNKILKSFHSAQEASASVGCDSQSIRNSCRNGKFCKGYLWKYEAKKSEDGPSENEIWKTIHSIRSHEISTFGRIRNIKRGSFQSTSVNKGGYCRTNINCKSYYVHILVVRTFIGAPPECERPIVNHKNGDKRDNRLENLEWCNSKESIQHAYDTGLISSLRPIVQYNTSGKTIAEYPSIAKAVKKIGTSHSAIRNACAKVNGYDMAAGFVWRYKDEPFESIKSLTSQKKLIQRDLNGNLVKEWGSMREAAESLEIKWTILSNVCRGKKRVYKDFHWTYG